MAALRLVGELGAADGVPSCAQGAGDVGRGHPVGRRLAVDGQLDRAAEAHGDLAAVGDGLVELGGDQVVLGDLDALGGQHLGDGVAVGADLRVSPSRVSWYGRLSAA